MRSRAFAWLKTGSINYEEDIPAEQPSSFEDARLPSAHVDPRQGPQVPVRLNHISGVTDVERLKSHRDFVTVLKCRRKVSDKDIVVHYLVRDDSSVLGDAAIDGRRLGLAVSKAVGNAVTRKTMKRRFRVLARQYESRLPERCDIVLRAKPSAARADFRSLDGQMASLFDAVSRKAAKCDRR